MNSLIIEYEKYKLENGLEVILHRNNNIPLVSVNIWYKVGSANEVKGKTGLAHLFEHMMFQGSEHVAKEMHFKLIQEAGGSLNGSTSFDRTNYYEKLPSNYLELALWLESDRMGFLLPAMTEEKLKNQIDVVSNERLERYDNQPYGLAWEIILQNIYPDNHPYNWATIGSLEDIKNFTLDDVNSFFTQYYSPSNATLVVCGDIDLDIAKGLIDKYFGELKSNVSNKNNSAATIKLLENKLINRKEDVQLERTHIAWPTEPSYSSFDAPLAVIADILSGSKGSRLYKKLVFNKQVAQDISAFQFSGKFGGHFMIISTAKPNVNLNEIKNLIFEEIENIAENGVSDFELIKSKNSIKAGFVYSMQNLSNLADHLNHYNFYLDEPNSFAFDLNRFESVTNEDIKIAAQNYLAKPYVELNISPKF